MANRMKDDEKNEKIIRGLLKLPANRRCINCNSLGPQYVCTNFWTFICTNCSGLHREYTHRVKSISMAKFSSQEVSALQEGGNERARGIFFKEWDPHRHSFPDSSHLDRLRDFIKHVYVERRYAGGKNFDGPSIVKGAREDYDENRRFGSYPSGSRSPPYDDSYERRYGEQPGSAGSYDDRNTRPNYGARSPNQDVRSPGNDQGDYRSPSRSEMREEIRRDDKAGNEVQKPKSNENKNSEGLPKSGVSDHQKGVYLSSPPMVRPVRDILGGDVPPLRVGEPVKIDGGKAPSIILEIQGTTSSSVGSNNGNSVELKRVNSGSLIDFSADSEPHVVAAQVSFPQPAASAPANGGGWASFDVSNQKKAPEGASVTGDLESVLAQLSVHTPAPVVNSAVSPTVGIDTFSNNSGQWPAEQQQPSHFPVASSRSINPLVQALASSFTNQVSAQLLSPTSIQSSTAVLDGQSSLPVMHPSQGTTSVGNSRNPLEAKPSGRKELPMDLFTGLYPTSSVPYPGWQIGPNHGMVYGMQYPAMMPVSAFHSPVSTNPFDLGNESAAAHNAMTRPLASLQGPLPNMSNLTSLPNSSKLASVPSQWTPPQQFFYPSSASPGPYMVQQFQHDRAQQHPSNLFLAMNQGAGGGSQPTHGISASNQIPSPTNSHLSSLTSFVPSVGGNPFG